MDDPPTEPAPARPDAAPAGLTLVPVGTGAAYGGPGEAQSCYLVRSARGAAVLDLGAGTLNRLRAQVEPAALDAVVVTHLHPDHCADLLALRVLLAFGPTRPAAPLRVLGPPDLRARLVAFAGPDLWDETLRFEALAAGGGEVVLWEGALLRHAEVPHLPPTHALRVEVGGRAVCHGADCVENEALVALARGADVLVAECSFGAGPVPSGAVHMDGPAAGRTAARAGVGRLLLTHCFPEHDREAARASAAAEFSGPVDWARPGDAVVA